VHQDPLARTLMVLPSMEVTLPSLRNCSTRAEMASVALITEFGTLRDTNSPFS